jgi:hypothetical protein
MHDLLHYAAEAEAGLENGFWGNLAKGKTLEEMNDRTGKALLAESPDIMVIERVVGVLSGLAKGRAPEELAEGFQSYAASIGSDVPAWLTVPFLSAVAERMRQLVGRWNATPYGETMELTWGKDS